MVAAKRESVTAVVVSNGRDVSYLSQVLAALGSQTPLPQHVVLSLPSSARSVLDELDVDDDVVVRLRDGGANLGQALAKTELPESDWLWVLHSDSAPEPEALDRLLRAGETAHRIGIVGPKQVDWDGATLLEVGIPATASGRRVPEIEPGELDQGQHDSRSDVLAVGTAGMLVRWQVWQDLQGLNERLGPFGDGLEFSRRARRAGWRVVVEPSAVVRHARQSLEPLEASFAERRSAQLFNALLAARGPLIVLRAIGYMLLSVPRALARLVFKEPGYARAELRAGLAAVGMLPAVYRGRREIKRTATVGASALTPLEATPADVRQARRESKRSRKEAQILAGRPDPLTIKARADLARHTRRGGWIVAGISVIFAIALHVQTFSSGVLAGGGLAGDGTVGTELLGRLFGGAAGGALGVDPLWVLALPLLLVGQPFGLTLGALATALVYLAVPAAAIFAYLAAGRFATSWVVRIFAALIWIGAPHFLFAMRAGQLGPTLVHVFLPLALFALVGARRGSASNLALLGLCFAVLTSAWPMFAVAALVIGVAGIATRKGQRKRWVVPPLMAALMIAPSVIAIWRAGRTASVGSGAVGSGAARSGAAGVVSLLFATPGVPNELTWHPTYFPQLVAIAVLATAALLALLRATGAWRIRIAWLIGAIGLLLAWAGPRVGVAVAGGATQTEISGSALPGYSIAWLGGWIAICIGAHGLRSALSQRGISLAHLFSAPAIVGVPLAALALLGLGGFRAVTEPPTLGPVGQLLPAVAREAQQNGHSVLAMSADDAGVLAQIWRGEGKELSEHTMAGGVSQVRAAKGQVEQPDAQAVQPDVQAIAALIGQSEVPELANYDVAIVLVTAEPDSPERLELVNRLQGSPVLQFINEGPAGASWRYTGPAPASSAKPEQPLWERALFAAQLVALAGVFIGALPLRANRRGYEH